jgi:hypothetical protein
MKERIGVAIGASCVLGLAYFCVFGIRTTRVGSLERLASQNVQIGATPEEVIHFLALRHLAPSPLFKPEFMSLGGHDYANQNIVVAVKRYSARALLWREAIYLVFVFDQNQKLVKYDVFPVYDSL